MSDTPKISQSAYVYRSRLDEACCPYCLSTAIAGGTVNIERNIATQEVSCHDCDKQWSDTYALTGFIEAE